jgi:Ran GTPase-activating protein (RanGAP) involved in mRNA processing and transport
VRSKGGELSVAINSKILQNIVTNKPSVVRLGNKDLSDEDMPSLVDALLKNPKIIALYLYNNNITAKGVELIKKVKALHFLDMSNNKIGDEGAKFLAESSTAIIKALLPLLLTSVISVYLIRHCTEDK